MFQVVGPVLTASLGMTISARMLAGNDDGATGITRAWAEIPKGAAFAAAGIAVLVVILAFQIFGLFVLLLLFAFMGPPILAQVIGVEKLGLREALRRVGELTDGRTWLYILNIAAGVGLVATFVLGGFGLGALDATELVRAVAFPIIQAALMGVLLGFLAAFEYEVFQDRRTATAADATPD